MSKINSLLSKRMKKSKAVSAKAVPSSQQSMFEERQPAAQLFRKGQLSSHEKEKLSLLLEEFATPQSTVQEDLQVLVSLTAEIKAIQHQAALLHGERIHQVHHILIRYREGAFTAWLLDTYGNRQTPYNFLQYYRLYTSLSLDLRAQVEMMPRQAIYSLASREGGMSQKEELIKSYQGETKEQMLQKIRLLFPLPEMDRRQPSIAQRVIRDLERILVVLARNSKKWTKRQKERVGELLEELDEDISQR